MRINLTLPQQLAERLDARAATTGLKPAQILRNLVAHHLPPVAEPAPAPTVEPVAVELPQIQERAPRVPKPPRVKLDDIADVVALYRSICVPKGCRDVDVDAQTGLPTPGVADKVRSAILRDRSRNWADYFRRVAASAFLCGERTEFAASLLWIIGPNNSAKIDAGQYDNATGTTPAANSAPAAQSFDF